MEVEGLEEEAVEDWVVVVVQEEVSAVEAVPEEGLEVDILEG